MGGGRFGGIGGGQGRCERRSEVLVNIKKNGWGRVEGGGGGGGGQGGCDFFFQKKLGGGGVRSGGSGLGGQGRCERRSEVLVKIQKKSGGSGLGGWGWSG